MSKIAFYAPIKPPDHAIPSGDRLIAQNLIKALTFGGHTVELASRFIAYSKRDADAILAERKAAAFAEVDAVVSRLSAAPPDVFVTYHPYCKAPDWIGPRVAAALSIPYVTVEAAKTGQGFEKGADRWRAWRMEAQAGIKTADRHIAFKPTDRAYLNSLGIEDTHIDALNPFIDLDALDKEVQATLTTNLSPQHWRADVPVLACVGMMRPGKKAKNYEILADALTPLQGLHWNLILIGDGPERGYIETLFQRFDPARIHVAGALTHAEVLAGLKAADLMVWPGWREPIGMVFLEAQTMGTPVAALDSMGVSLSVRHGETGLLATVETASSLSEQLHLLLSQPSLRNDLAAKTRTHIERNHSLEAAAHQLSASLQKLV
ncbi:MAG: glycosyltransferase family 4 protein [Pseudomonadota bacterium]